MNIQEEKRVCFDVDQNKQKINYLMKKLKEKSDKIDEIAKDINDINTKIDEIENQEPDPADEQEEVVQLQSYDIFRAKDNVHRNNRWQPQPIFFVAQPGSYFKLHIYYTIKHDTYPETQTITLTTKLDDVEIKQEIFELLKNETHDIDFVYETFSSTKGHKIEFELLSSAGIAYATTSVAPEYYTIELTGTNVQFISRKFDLEIFTAGDKVVMSSCNFDTNARVSIQTADENLSFDVSNFRKYILATYNRPNQIIPYIFYTIDSETQTPTYSQYPGLIWRSYTNAGTYAFARSSFNINCGETEVVSNSFTIGSAVFLAKPTIMSDTSDVPNSSPNLIALTSTNMVLLNHAGAIKTQISQQSCGQLADCAQVCRIDNYIPNLDIPVIITRSDGSSFFFVTKKENETDVTILELGFGTHINAYATLEGFVVFMRVGSNVKRLLINKDQTGAYKIMSKTTLPNLHEYWIGPNGSHFERFGNVVKFFLANQTTPTATIDLTISST